MISYPAPLSYFSATDLADLDTAEGFEDLRVVALRVIDRMPPHCSMVCGPITSGGKTVEENLRRLGCAIEMLASYGVNVFNQIPFEAPIERIRAKMDRYAGVIALRNEFYLPLFQSGKITSLRFLPNWDKSVSAVWKHEQAIKLDIDCEYFRSDFELLNRIFQKYPKE